MKLILFLVFSCLFVGGRQQNLTKSKEEELPTSFVRIQDSTTAPRLDNSVRNCDCECKSDQNTIDVNGVYYCVDDSCCASKSLKNEVRCGRRKENGTMHPNVNEALMGEFPWMVVLLGENDDLVCGASLIHPQVVLTAAHCVRNRNDSLKIRAGEWDISVTDELYPHQDRGIKEIVVHPRYHNGTLFYDVALLVLESPVQITENVDVVCLPDVNGLVSSNQFCYGTGWGRKVFTKKSDTTILKKVGLTIVDRDTCLKRLRSTRLGSHFKLHESFICAGGEPGLDLCKGDGGGPLVCPVPEGEGGRFYQAGIVAWGISCGEDVPGAYVDMVKVSGWIDEMMVSRNFDTTIYHY